GAEVGDLVFAGNGAFFQPHLLAPDAIEQGAGDEFGSFAAVAEFGPFARRFEVGFDAPESWTLPEAGDVVVDVGGEVDRPFSGRGAQVAGFEPEVEDFGRGGVTAAALEEFKWVAEFFQFLVRVVSRVADHVGEGDAANLVIAGHRVFDQRVGLDPG